MNVVYARRPLPGSIFLAGPTPRDKDTQSWRPEALRLLEKFGFAGTVYVPEDDFYREDFDYDSQVGWEIAALNRSAAILFCVPRNGDLPGFTTNVEFGLFASKLNVVLGYPEGAERMKYLHVQADRFGIPVHHTLPETILAAMKMAVEFKER